MKKIAKVLMILSLVYLSTSCKKESTLKKADDNNSSAKEQISEFYSSGSNSYDGFIWIVNDYLQTKYDKTSYNFSFQGELPDNTNYSNISFNNYSIPINTNNYFYSSSSIDTVNLQGNLNSYFGTNNSIEIDGNSFIQNFYIPKPIKISFPNNSDFKFKKSDGIPINLSIDENNNNPIIIVIEYIDDDNSEGHVYLTKTYQLDAQETNFTIPSSDLLQFPTDKSLILYVGCGNGKTISFDNKDYDLEGINITYLPSIKLY